MNPNSYIGQNKLRTSFFLLSFNVRITEDVLRLPDPGR